MWLLHGVSYAVSALIPPKDRLLAILQLMKQGAGVTQLCGLGISEWCLPAPPEQPRSQGEAGPAAWMLQQLLEASWSPLGSEYPAPTLPARFQPSQSISEGCELCDTEVT